MKTKELASRILRTTFLTGVAATAVAPAFAQDDEGSDDRIVVTGSRIVREDLSAPSPVARVDTEQLTLTNTVNTEQFLNTLPQVIPAFDSTSNNPGNGAATVNLRGLGTNRTLVLVDGSRFVASGAGGGFGIVDLNSIPAALVERIEVLTGGASAVYGSDAVAGVVNFILKDDFEGVQLDVSDELSAAGWDANTFNAALTMGGNFADGRGNAIFSLSYTNREGLQQGDRDFSRDTFQDLGGPTFALGGSAAPLGGAFFPLEADSAWDTDPVTPGIQAPACAVPGQCGGGFLTFLNSPDGRGWADPTDRYNYAPVNYLQIPQERYSIYAGGAYEIADNIELYARGVFAASSVVQVLAPTPVGGTYAINLDNPNITPAFRDTLLATYSGPGEIADLDGDGEVDDVNVFFARRFTETSTRDGLHDANTFQFKAGLRGDVFEDWSYDVFFQFGRSFADDGATGNISDRALRAGILNGTVNIFGNGTIDPAGAQSITVTALSRTESEQTQIVGTLSGILDQFVMPGAENGVGLAVGVEYREEAGSFLPDSAAGPDVRGFNAALPIGGRYDVYEAFMETEIPIIEDMTFVESFTINGAYRFSEYSTGAGTTHTFAVGGEWVPVDGLRIRSQFQRAVRAPNITELFAPQVNGFPGASDPCAGGANGAFNDYDAATQAIITAQCLAYGVPAASIGGAAIQTNAQIEMLFGGNPNVGAEVSDTLTIGAVWSPSMIDGLTLQVDFYDIKIEGAIGTLAPQTILDRCYVQALTDVCDQYFGPGTRSPTGRIGAPFFPALLSSNLGSLDARGIDINASYGFDWADFGMSEDMGSMSFVYYGSYTMQASTTPDAVSAPIECVGLYGNTCTEPTPQYKHTMQASWLWGPLTTSVRWRLLTGVEEDGSGGASDLSDDIPMFNYVDVTLGYALSEHLDLTIGVQNIMGKEPPLLGSCCNEQANTWPATYETLGRQVFFGASLRF